MLILTRRPGETILIGDNITVSVVGIRGNQVRLSLDAPPNVRIDREEVRMRAGIEKDLGLPAPAKKVESRSRKTAS
jgi:carbon storage regulator